VRVTGRNRWHSNHYIQSDQGKDHCPENEKSTCMNEVGREVTLLWQELFKFSSLALINDENDMKVKMRRMVADEEGDNKEVEEYPCGSCKQCFPPCF